MTAVAAASVVVRKYDRTSIVLHWTIALLIVVIFSMPRVMIGAHWFTDIAVGSLSIVLVGMGWVLLTPLSDKIINVINHHLPGAKS